MYSPRNMHRFVSVTLAQIQNHEFLTAAFQTRFELHRVDSVLDLPQRDLPNAARAKTDHRQGLAGNCGA